MKDIDWTAWFYTILLIVVFREIVAITKVFNHPELGNLVGDESACNVNLEHLERFRIA